MLETDHKTTGRGITGHNKPVAINLTVVSNKVAADKISNDLTSKPGHKGRNKTAGRNSKVEVSTTVAHKTNKGLARAPETQTKKKNNEQIKVASCFIA